MKKRENFYKLFKLHLACGINDVRVELQYIYFNDGYAHATDAHIMVKIAIEHIMPNNIKGVEHLNGKFLHGNVYKKILKYSKIEICEDGIICFCKYGKIKYLFDGIIGDMYPKFDLIINRFYDDTTSEKIYSTNINPYLLNKLRQAMGLRNRNPVTLLQKSENEVIRAYSKMQEAESMDVAAFIMPAIID